jgi:hypothetical protein
MPWESAGALLSVSKFIANILAGDRVFDLGKKPAPHHLQWIRHSAAIDLLLA